MKLQAPQIWLALEPIDMRIGIDGLSLRVQQALGKRRSNRFRLPEAKTRGHVLSED